MLFGAGLGLLGGASSGVLIYFSLARIKTQQLFRVTNGLILLLAGSLASQLARSLAQSGLVDAAVEPLFYFGAHHAYPTDLAASQICSNGPPPSCAYR